MAERLRLVHSHVQWKKKTTSVGRCWLLSFKPPCVRFSAWMTASVSAPDAAVCVFPLQWWSLWSHWLGLRLMLMGSRSLKRSSSNKVHTPQAASRTAVIPCWMLNVGLSVRGRSSHRHGQEPRVPLQPPGASEAGERAQRSCRAAGGARGLELCPEGASGETRHRHQTGDGKEVKIARSVVMVR